MSFGDERDESPDEDPSSGRIKWNTVEFDAREKAQVRSQTMAAFCASIPPEDWLVLQQLSERTRVGLLKQCLRVMLRTRR